MLEKNENPYPAPIDWNSCLSNIELNRYPDSSYSELKKKLSETLGVDCSNLSLGNGSDDVIQNTIFALSSAGDEIVSFSPTFSEYKRICELRGATYVEIQLKPPFIPDIDQLIRYAESNNPKVIILCNPNNPTGQVIEKSEILKLLNQTNAFVIIDEAYIDFGGETVMPEIFQYKNLVVLRTFSKGYGLAALRFGFAVSSSSNIELIEAKRAPYNVNQLTVSAVHYLLDNLAPVQERINQLKKERDRVQNKLHQLKIPYIHSSGNFILFRPKSVSRFKSELSSSTFSMRFFDDHLLKSFIRFSIGTEQENNEVLNLIQGSKERRSYD